MSRSLGIPVKLLHEAASHIVAVELKSGELYRGSLVKCEDNWNCQVENVTFTAKIKCIQTFSQTPRTFKPEHHLPPTAATIVGNLTTTTVASLPAS
ncbi:unnamed protein product [Lactuca virosa]|uniref:Sm domain-containing protein n=1 Tax=Lactuca virosa TaxID=75947 RepID=A0AAU9PGP3_9ASTR|nr:unnamed protein product [Lactuca virosa]